MPHRYERGGLLALDVHLDAEKTLSNLAIEIPVPAGFELVDHRFTSSAKERFGVSETPWITREETHPDRARIEAEYLAPGAYRATVFVRAKHAGEFRFPPTHAELVYHPAWHARTDASRMTVKR